MAEVSQQPQVRMTLTDEPLAASAMSSSVVQASVQTQAASLPTPADVVVVPEPPASIAVTPVSTQTPISIPEPLVSDVSVTPVAPVVASAPPVAQSPAPTVSPTPVVTVTVPVTAVTPVADVAERAMPASTAAVLVTGKVFPANGRFPQTGFVGAKFQVLMNGRDPQDNAQYQWHSNQSWVSVDNAGTVLFTAMPTPQTLTVTLDCHADGGRHTINSELHTQPLVHQCESRENDGPGGHCLVPVSGQWFYPARSDSDDGHDRGVALLARTQWQALE
ncbi:hypothetical protein [Budvicia aquatica]|nr:hypothetical protein [Budvicia aquatica]